MNAEKTHTAIYSTWACFTFRHLVALSGFRGGVFSTHSIGDGVSAKYALRAT